MYIYIYMFVYKNTYIYTHINANICTCMYEYSCIYICISVYTCNDPLKFSTPWFTHDLYIRLTVTIPKGRVDAGADSYLVRTRFDCGSPSKSAGAERLDSGHSVAPSSPNHFPNPCGLEESVGGPGPPTDSSRPGGPGPPTDSSRPRQHPHSFALLS